MRPSWDVVCAMLSLRHSLLIDGQGEVVDITVEHESAVQCRGKGLRHGPRQGLIATACHSFGRGEQQTHDCGRILPEGFHSRSISISVKVIMIGLESRCEGRAVGSKKVDLVEGYMCDLSGGATPHGRSQYIQRGEEVEIAERNSRGSSEKDHRVGSGVPSRGRCRGSLGQSSLRAVILRQPPTNNPDKRVASKLEGEGIAD